MISVVTPTYRTDPNVLARTWASLKAQTYTDWEWVVWDDTPGDEVWRQLYGLAADERYRIVAHRSHVPSGSIGRVKRRGFMVAEGDVLVELDHDDELTPDALATIAGAFDDDEVGFVYSDWCEILADGRSGRYPEGWAFGYGSDYWDEDHGVWVMRAPALNATTLGHIVSAPNHVRAWRASVYREIGGHDPSLPVADDYDLVVRTALATNCVHVPRMLYRQHVGPTTAQRTRNDEIQRLVSDIAGRYHDALVVRYGGA
jgi:glycosyltransferase involved in cell wall biosynthesis